uniref:Uncharacterized protein n=1 Tax=Glyptapanteles indiensis TaxID=92994 RepID=A0JCU9_GLYIN|nr:hypothetical protein GIP_L1_00200 [Glyptapanteles indiensis]
MSGSKVVLLVLAVGLISLFNGVSGRSAYDVSSSSLKIEDGGVPPGYYDSMFKTVETALKTESHGARTIGDQNTVQESKSTGFLNSGSKIDYSENHHDENGSDDKGPLAFTLGTHNTFQSSNSNMTTNMGSWVTYGNNVYSSK